MEAFDGSARRSREALKGYDDWGAREIVLGSFGSRKAKSRNAGSAATVRIRYLRMSK